MKTHAKALVKTALALLLVLLVVVGHAAAQSGGDSFRALQIPPGQATSDDFIELLLPYLRNHPETGEGNAGLDLDIRKEGDVYRVDILLSGYLDDSISGELYRGTVIFTGDGQWQLVSMAVKAFCARGRPGNGLCP